MKDTLKDKEEEEKEGCPIPLLLFLCGRCGWGVRTPLR
jgi:hypothetical protein